MYGLEVCKSLSLPEDFIKTAYNIRSKYNPENGSILSLKTSHYNSKKIVNKCEVCGEATGTEVHHLQHQSDANDDGIIVTNDTIFHKNNLANLITICNNCHDNIHKKNIKYKKVKTTKGYKMKEIN
jgi:5-methylcytosine-specific restriction endonuclease McrA